MVILEMEEKDHVIGGYSAQDTHRIQLDDSVIGSVLLAKEKGQKPEEEICKTFAPEIRRLFQQWDQLIIKEGVLFPLFENNNSPAARSTQGVCTDHRF